MEKADFVVIGGGIVGITVAFHLAKARAGKIILCERKFVGSGNSSMSDAMCGQQAEITDTISRLAIRARHIYDNFADFVGGDCGFRNYGILSLTKDKSEAETREQSARKNGSDVEAISIEQVQQFYPVPINAEGWGAAALYRGTGHVDVYKTMRSYVRQGLRLGVDLREFTPVTGFQIEDGTVKAVETSRGSISPGKVVLACGPWSRRVGALAGLNLPIDPVQVDVVFYDRPPGFPDRLPVLGAEFPIFSWYGNGFRMLHAKRSPRLKLEPDASDAVSRDWVVEETTNALQQLIPLMKQGRVRGACQPVFADTPDLRPMLGFVPEISNLFLDTGWSGRGFKFSVALGEYIARWLTEGSVDLDLAPWLATRYDLFKS